MMSWDESVVFPSHNKAGIYIYASICTYMSICRYMCISTYWTLNRWTFKSFFLAIISGRLKWSARKRIHQCADNFRCGPPNETVSLVELVAIPPLQWKPQKGPTHTNWLSLPSHLSLTFQTRPSQFTLQSFLVLRMPQDRIFTLRKTPTKMADD